MRSSTSEIHRPASTPLRLCVVCDVPPRDWPGFKEEAIALGRAVAAAGFDLVCVGQASDVAEWIAQEVGAGGGRVIGVECPATNEYTTWIARIDEHVPAADSQHRKQLMYELADAVVVLPGGALVLDILMELLTWMQKGRPHKPVYLANAGGYWAPLLKMFEHMEGQDYLPHNFRDRFELVRDPLDAVADLIRCYGIRCDEGRS